MTKLYYRAVLQVEVLDQIKDKNMYTLGRVKKIKGLSFKQYCQKSIRIVKS